MWGDNGGIRRKGLEGGVDFIMYFVKTMSNFKKGKI